MLLTVIALMSSASADCMSGSLSVSPPPNTELPAAAQVVVQAYGSDRPTLAKSTSFQLARGGEHIDLERVAQLHGSFMDDQLVLTPERAPGAGSWTLELDGEPLTLWTGKAHEAVQWQFSAPDPEPPTWAGAPAVVEKARQHFGCGPGVSVVVSVPTRDAVWMEAEVEAGGDPPVQVRLPIQDGRVTLGHGMCSGLLELTMDQVTLVQLTPIGADGRRGETSRPLKFVAP